MFIIEGSEGYVSGASNLNGMISWTPTKERAIKFSSILEARQFTFKYCRLKGSTILPI